MSKIDLLDIPEALKRLLRIGEIKVTCLDGNDVCEKGFCDAKVSYSEERGVFSLVTGIVPNPDHLGSAKFKIEDIQKIVELEVTVLAHHNARKTSIMKLSPRRT